jgi:hypothetical protein
MSLIEHMHLMLLVAKLEEIFLVLKGVVFGFFLFMYVIQHFFIYRPSDSNVSEDAETEPRTVATLALTAMQTL